MKNKIIYKIAIFVCILSLGLTSCSDDDAPVTFVTNFPVLTLNGDEIMYVEEGSDFVDPGVLATIDGAPTDYVITNEADVNTPDIYEVTYTATNSDGFERSLTRAVYVYQNNGSLAGIYDGVRVGRSGGPILLVDNGGDSYTISDVCAGHYEYDRALGLAYRATTTTTISNGVIEPSAGTNPFGDWNIDSGIDNGDGTLTWTADLLGQGFSFPVELTKVTP